MSDTASSLADARPDAQVEIRTHRPRGMVTLRGDIASGPLKRAVSRLSGVDVPARGRISLTGDGGVAWMSPDELLLLTAHGAADAAAASLSKALAGQHHLALNVSDARTTFTLGGSNIREVLAKLSPADLSPGAFGAGQIRRTRLAQVPVAFWFSAQDRLELICFRSVSDYVFELLANAAAPDGTVNFF